MSTCRPLIEVLSEIPDFRNNRGKRHPLSSILALATVAMLCGSKSYSAIAEWGRNYGQHLVKALGFTHQKSPCAATLHTVFRHLGRQVVESKLGAWAEALLASVPPVNDKKEGLSLDGKSLRGSQKQGAPGCHLLSVVSHRLGLTLAQQSVDDKTNEIPVAPQVLEALVLEGRVVTADAMHTQKETAKAIIGHQGDYVMLVKDNQPSLLEAIQFLFQDGGQSDPKLSVAETVDCGHGRIEYRRLRASSELSDYIDWPGLQQVFELKRTVTQVKSEESRSEIVFGITSLSEQQARPKCLLEYVRQYWHIENKSHWVRDVTFGEDHSQVRCGSIPQVMAALRNTVIGLMRWSGATNIAAATRRFAAQPSQALRLIGIGV